MRISTGKKGKNTSEQGNNHRLNGVLRPFNVNLALGKLIVTEMFFSEDVCSIDLEAVQWNRFDPG